MSESEDDEDFMAAKMASMLSNYYGTVEDPADDDGDGGGADSPAHTGQAEDNIDSSNFDASEYAVNMLQNESLAGLLERDATLVQEIKSIDSDMKMLVHENYNKFISATDTIRSMRHNVDEMEQKMDELRQDMESIYGKAEEITSQLAPARTKIEKLVSVRQLLKKLEFLFELPLRLSRSIELKAYAQAVKYYSTARGVLNDHLDVPSFRNILVEADAIISKLKTDIQTWIQGDDISAPKLAQYMKLLLSLQDNGDNADSDSSLLHVRYMEWHRERLTWMLHRHSAEVAADGSAEPPEPEGWPFEALSVDAFVTSLKRSVVQGFVDMCHMYVGIFGHAGLGTRAGDLHPDLLQFGSDLFLDFFALCKKKILSSPAATTAASVAAATATTTTDGHGEDPRGGEDTGRGGRGGRGRQDKEAVAASGRRGGLGPLSAALQAMQQCAQLIHQVVPSFRAHARLAETLENVVRHRVQALFHTLHASTVDRLLRACAAVSVSAPALTSNGSSLAAQAPASAALDPGSARATAQQVVDDIGRVLGSLRPLVELGADSAIVTDMPRIFCDLVQRQLHGYFLWLNNALQALAENDDPSIIVAVVDAHERDIGDAGGADDGSPGAAGTGAGAGAGNDGDGPTGLGVDIPDKPRVTPASAGIALLMACISRRLETHGVTDAKTMLATHLPQLGLSAGPDHENERARGRGWGHRDGGDADAGGALDVRELVKQARATTQSLLERYVHLLADRLADIVEARFSGADWLRHEEPRAVSPYCTECFLALGAVVDEVRRLTDNPDFELCTIPRRPVFKVPTVAGGSGGGGGGRGRASGSDGGRASGGGGGGGGDAGGAHGTAADGSEPGIRLNIERLFTQKLRLYEGITFAPQTIVTACVAATLKTLHEAARLCTFAKFGFQQAQIDASFLRVMLPRFGVKVDQGGLDTLLDEFVASVHARCVAPMDVDVAVVDTMIRYKRDELGV